VNGGVSVLIDSNVFIAAAAHPHEGHAYGAEAAELLRLCSQMGFRLLISHGTRADISRAGNRRASRERELSKFFVLDAVHIPDTLARDAGFPAAMSVSDQADLEVLATYHAGLGDWLVSNDGTFRKRAKRVVHDPDLVYSLAEALDSLRRFLNTPTQMPAVATVKAYQLNLDAPIFDSLKDSYPQTDQDQGFVRWWREKVIADQRPAIILGETNDPQGVAVLKDETAPDYGLTGRVTKICTLKVDDDFAGTKRGEALLKAVIDHARLNNRDTLFVEVLPTVHMLAGWLEEFGFRMIAKVTTSRGELVYEKRLVPREGDEPLSALAHAVMYGPGAALVDRVYLVPIRARWHHRLLPEADPQRSLDPLGEPCGNAIRKAYLCHAPIRQLQAGDLLVFILTGVGVARATCTGVVEGTMATRDPGELVRFVGSRTVYSVPEIQSKTSKGEVLAVRFRLDRVLPQPWRADTLRSEHVMVRTPQSIATARQEGIAWLRTQLAG
jgi:GNAT superfamily N-acetyltransferase